MTDSPTSPHADDTTEAVLAFLSSEEERLTTEDRPDPWQVPMLGNYLGGIKAAADHLAAVVARPTPEGTALAADGCLPTAECQNCVHGCPKAEPDGESDDLRAVLDGAGDGLAAVKAEALREAARELREQGALRFDAHGPLDVRGAALWDAGCHIDPDDGAALATPEPAREEAAGGEGRG